MPERGSLGCRTCICVFYGRGEDERGGRRYFEKLENRKPAARIPVRLLSQSGPNHPMPKSKNKSANERISCMKNVAAWMETQWRTGWSPKKKCWVPDKLKQPRQRPNQIFVFFPPPSPGVFLCSLSAKEGKRFVSLLYEADSPRACSGKVRLGPRLNPNKLFQCQRYHIRLSRSRAYRAMFKESVWRGPVSASEPAVAFMNRAL
jgi:hypothetical protein